MLKKLLLCVGSVLLGQFSVQAQHRTCGTMGHLNKLEQQYPGTKAQFAQTNRELVAAQAKTGQRVSATLLTIPVVVHVVYKTAIQNITDAQIQSQLDVLNEDYNKKNADTSLIPAAFKPLLGNMQIRFELAKRNPDGDPTNGITRTQTTVTSFQDDDAMKFNNRGGHDIWNRDKYLNIWVCNMGSGILGYAQFPGAGPANADGVVIGYKYFGRIGTVATPFAKGRTTTHEVGHWLNLNHIWGDEPACGADDMVADTPLQKDHNFGCPVYPLISGAGSSCSGTAPGAMFMNYMDYVDDACMFMFSAGQCSRAQTALNVKRASLATSDGLTPVGVKSLDASILQISSPKANTCYTAVTPKFTLKNRGTASLTSVTISYKLDNGASNTLQWTGNLASLGVVPVTLPGFTTAAGSHTFTVSTSAPNGQTDNDPSNDSQVLAFTVTQQTAGQNLPMAESFEGTVFPPTGWSSNNSDNDITWGRTNRAQVDGSYSAYMNNYDYNFIGEVDELLLPALNLSSQASPQLSFQLAYSPSSFSLPSDTLEVLASSDCGETFMSLYKKTGQALATTTSVSSLDFIPNTSQWRMETVNLGALATNNSVILKFKNTNHFENNLYLDDVKVTGVLGVKPEDFAPGMALFPNPTTGMVTLQHPGFANADITVTDAIGRIVLHQTVEKSSQTILNLSEKPGGIYIVKVAVPDRTFTRKLILTK